MTMRVKIEIVPFGDESKTYEIHRLDIFNKGPVGFGHDEYGCIEINPERNEAGLHTGTVVHQRHLGAYKLLEKVLRELINKEIKMNDTTEQTIETTPVEAPKTEASKEGTLTPVAETEVVIETSVA